MTLKEVCEYYVKHGEFPRVKVENNIHFKAGKVYGIRHSGQTLISVKWDDYFILTDNPWPIARLTIIQPEEEG